MSLNDTIVVLTKREGEGRKLLNLANNEVKKLRKELSDFKNNFN